MEGSVLTIDFVRKAMEKHHHTKEVTPPTPLASEAANKVIKLDRNFTLMPGWEQCLDTKTGKLYYISQKTGIRVDINDNDTDGNNMAINGEMKGKSTVCAAPTLMGKAVEANNLLLLVTCKRCIKYMMVSKPTKTCPRCSGALIQFIDEKCF